jgi:hypothetical protein
MFRKIIPLRTYPASNGRGLSLFAIFTYYHIFHKG